ncbi:MAG: type II secretion system protein [Patescibacteria group bacterium]
MLYSVTSPSTQRGFTLIEMLIVIAIFALLTGGAVVSYRAFYQRQQVLQSAKNLQEAMRFAQKKARVGEKPAGCQTLNGYIVTGTTSSAIITLTADCTNQDYVVTTATLAGSALLTTNLNKTFRVITGGVVNPGTVSLVYGTYTYTFNVNVGGEITEGAYE